MTLRDREAVTLRCANCGYRVHQVGLTWVHPDMKGTCPRSGCVKAVQVATPTVWPESVVGAPF